MRVFCGIDWASDHHDVVIIDDTGLLRTRARLDDTAEGLAQLLKLLAEHGDSPTEPTPVAIETPCGLLVACLRATGRSVYAINPLAVARYRGRHTVTGKKSDHLDAMILANILRTDAAVHRVLPADTELAQAIAVREYFPGFLAAVKIRREGVAHPIARILLAAAPTPEQAAKLTRPQLRALLKKAGRKTLSMPRQSDFMSPCG